MVQKWWRNESRENKRGGNTLRSREASWVENTPSGKRGEPDGFLVENISLQKEDVGRSRVKALKDARWEIRPFGKVSKWASGAYLAILLGIEV